MINDIVRKIEGARLAQGMAEMNTGELRDTYCNKAHDFVDIARELLNKYIIDNEKLLDLVYELRQESISCGHPLATGLTRDAAGETYAEIKTMLNIVDNKTKE